MSVHSGTATLFSRLVQTKDRPSGFDYLRLFLSVTIIAWHTIWVCYGVTAQAAFWHGPFRAFFYFLVPSFFALSGFLVAGSLERNTLTSFLTLRAIRIYPALICEVVLSAFFIGPLLTSFSLSDYFSDPRFYSYLLNALGDIHYILPGLFESNPGGPRVNVQLWTIPFELRCYAAIALLALIGLTRRPIVLTSLLIAISVLALIYPPLQERVSPNVDGPSGWATVMAFLFGAVLYFLRRRVPFNPALCLLSFAVSWALLSFPVATFLAPLPVAYLTVYIGLQNPPRTPISKAADYSYGLYLYGFVCQQTVSYLLPDYRIWYINLGLSLLLAGFCAVCSWHFVESKIMDRRKHFLRTAENLSLRIRGLIVRRPKSVAEKETPESAPSAPAK